MEQKLQPQFTKAIDDRTVTGIFAVHGNVDEGNDRSWPGSFANVTVNGRNRTRFLWMHNSNDPPIAVIKSVREVLRDELPPSVLGYAPEAMGGVEVTREYLDTPRGNEVLQGIRKGAIEEMSYAYDVTRFDFETVGEKQIRNIREIKLYDISDVTWGMNPATVAVKSKLLAGLPLADHSDAALAAVDEFIQRYEALAKMGVKEGRIFSSARLAAMIEIADALDAYNGRLRSLIQEAEPQKTVSLDALRAQSNRLRAALIAKGTFTP